MGVTASACNSVRQKDEVNPRTLVRVPSRARLADLLKPASKLNLDNSAAQRSASGTPVAELARLYITSGQKLVQHEPTFDPRVHAYRVQVPNDCEFVVVTPVPYDLLAKVSVEINGSAATQVIDEYLQQILFPHALTNEVSPPHPMLDSFLCDPLLSGGGAPANRKVNVVKINVTTDQGLSIQYILEVERKEWSPDGWRDQEGTFYQLFHSVQALSGDSSEHRLRRQKLRWYTLGAELGSPEAQYHVALMYGGEDGFVEVRSDGRDYLDFSEEDALARRKVEVMAKYKTAQEEKAERLRQIAAYNPQDPTAQPVPPFDESIFEKLEQENEDIDNAVRTLESLWVRMDPAEADLLHFKWLLVAANNEHMESQMRLARLFFAERVQNGWLNDPQVKELREKKTPQEAPDEAGEDGEVKTAKGEVNLKKEAGEWYKRAAMQGNADAAAILGQMYMEGIGYRCNFRRAIYWFIQSGKPQEEAEIEVANYYRKLAESGVGDAKAALQLAQMSIDGVGVPMSFDKATFLFRRAGKSEEFAKTQIERKLNTLRPRFKELFDAHDHDKDGDIDKQEFVGFYRDCLMAKGLDAERANDEAISSYQGVMKCDVAFKAYDINGDGTISFDEIWTNRHKISNLIPKTEKHYLAAVKFFSVWRMEIDRKQTLTGGAQAEPENVRLYRLQTEFQLYREVDRMSTRSLTRGPTVAVNDQGVKTERTQTISRAPTQNSTSQRNLNRTRTKSQGGQY